MHAILGPPLELQLVLRDAAHAAHAHHTGPKHGMATLQPAARPGGATALGPPLACQGAQARTRSS